MVSAELKETLEKILGPKTYYQLGREVGAANWACMCRCVNHMARRS